MSNKITTNQNNHLINSLSEIAEKSQLKGENNMNKNQKIYEEDFNQSDNSKHDQNFAMTYKTMNSEILKSKFSDVNDFDVISKKNIPNFENKFSNQSQGYHLQYPNNTLAAKHDFENKSYSNKDNININKSAIKNDFIDLIKNGNVGSEMSKIAMIDGNSIYIPDPYLSLMTNNFSIRNDITNYTNNIITSGPCTVISYDPSIEQINDDKDPMKNNQMKEIQIKQTNFAQKFICTNETVKVENPEAILSYLYKKSQEKKNLFILGLDNPSGFVVNQNISENKVTLNELRKNPITNILKLIELTSNPNESCKFIMSYKMLNLLRSIYLENNKNLLIEQINCNYYMLGHQIIIVNEIDGVCKQENKSCILFGEFSAINTTTSPGRFFLSNDNIPHQTIYFSYGVGMEQLSEKSPIARSIVSFE